MKKGFWSEQWYKYRRKKTVLGIVFDLMFTALLVALIFPASRKLVQSTVIRYSMFQPRLAKEVTYLSSNDFDWRVEDMNGNIVGLSNFKGQAIFLNFWATWCPPCIAEMPSIQRLYNDYESKMAFILVSQESQSTLKAFMHEKGYTFPIYILRGGKPEIFSSRSIPASFLISPEGKVLMKKQGAARWDGSKVKALIDKMQL